jgi:large subunit ribosomal protein L21e
MVQKIGGARRKTRSKMTKRLREKSKLSINRYFQSFNIGDKVVLKAEPSVQQGIYPVRRFHGKIGTIREKMTRCYKVAIRDQDKKEKILIVHPVHMKKVIQ